MKYKISVIIPTYRPGSYLWECLDSVFYQTFNSSDYEIIIALNGEIDDYEADIDDYIVKRPDKNVKILKVQEKGASIARNAALDIAEGEYIAFIDDDDYVSPSYLQELYAIATHDNVALCHPIAIDYLSKERIEYQIENEFFLNRNNQKLKFWRSRKFFSGACMKLIHRDIIGARRFDIRFELGEDSVFMFLISDRFSHVTYTDENAIYFRTLRPGSMTRSPISFEKKLKNSIRLVIEFTRIYFSGFWHYNFVFYATRVLGVVKNLFA